MSANDEAIAEAARVMRAGGLVGMPTETVYGLAADATNGDAVARIYERKGRPRFNPLIVHVASVEQAWTIAEPVGDTTRALAARFWPGPLTLVLPARPGNAIAHLVTAGLDTIAVRVPGHDVARALITVTGRPLAAPSANRSGQISPTTAADVTAELGNELPVIDGGPCERGLESTILSVSRAGAISLLRAGSVPAAKIEALIGVSLIRAFRDGSRPDAPGQLASHYAPRARVRRNVTDVGPGEALLAFGPLPLPCMGPTINLSPTGDLVEAARNLFGALRRLDATGTETIAVMPIPDTGLGEAINDRLGRAAAGRP